MKNYVTITKVKAHKNLIEMLKQDQKMVAAGLNGTAFPPIIRCPPGSRNQSPTGKYLSTARATADIARPPSPGG